MAATQTPAIFGQEGRFKGVSGISDYEVISKLGEGTFGEVHKARNVKSRQVVALKKILMHNEKDGFPITALREIKLMKLLSHPNILKLEDMAIERPRSKGKEKPKAIIYMVTPYMDHDLSGLLENPAVNFTAGQIKCYLLQLLEGVRFLHNSHILHRDMKAANLLINNEGVLQIADFGLARHYDEPVPRAGRGCGEARRDYTSLVVTRWYRPPELLLQLRKYTPAVDMWGVGCVFAEMFKRQPILMGKSDLNQAQIIFDLVGSPNDDSMPGWNDLPGCEGTKIFTDRPGKLRSEFAVIGSQGLDLLQELLKLDWRKRINAIDALEHPYFKTPPLPAQRNELPRYEDSHELDRRRFKDQRAQHGPLPPAPAGGTVGGGPPGDWMNGMPQNGSAAFHDNDRDSHRRGYHQGHARGPPRGDRIPERTDRFSGTDRVPGGDRVPGPGEDRPRPGWQRGTNNGTNGGGGNRVPRPGEPITNGGPPRRPNVDTYIPSYDGAPPRREEGGRPRDDRDRDRRPPRDDRDHRDWDRDRDRDRDREYRRDYRERDRDYGGARDRDYDRDRAPPSRGGGSGYSDRGRSSLADRTNVVGQRRTRSRSPERKPPQDHRDEATMLYRR